MHLEKNSAEKERSPWPSSQLDMQATERLPGFSGSNTEGGGVPNELNFETLM